MQRVQMVFAATAVIFATPTELSAQTADADPQAARYGLRVAQSTMQGMDHGNNQTEMSHGTSDDMAPAARVRVGKHAGFSRVVFDWESRVPYRVVRQQGQVTVHFERPATLDLSRYRPNRLPFVKGITPRPEGGGLAVRIKVPEGARVRDSEHGTHVVIDVHGPATGAVAHAATRQPVRAAEASAPQTQLAAQPGMAGMNHGGQGTATMQGMSDGNTQMTMSHGMGHQMGPDNAPPVGVMGGMSPPRGRFMLSLRYMHMSMDGNRDGTDKVSISEVLNDFMVAPLDMDMDMIMLGGMYGITDDLTGSIMVPYIRKEMSHINGIGVEFDTVSEGMGDVRLGLGYRVWNQGGHQLQVVAGLSLPTGSTDEIDDTPLGSDQVLPYPMQIGSGTFDLLPSVVYQGGWRQVSWGAQAGATIRIGENSEDYTLGNIYQGSAWGAYRWADWVSSSLRLRGEIEENIDGADSRLNPMMVPTADPDLRGGERLEVGLGLNFMVPSGPVQGLGFSIEGLMPVYQNLDGPQLERDWSIIVGVRKMF